jgi:hypothetical protein
MVRAFLGLVLLAAMVGASGCIAVGGESNRVTPTRGQELIDLKSALDRGAITQAEYDQTKAQIVSRK